MTLKCGRGDLVFRKSTKQLGEVSTISKRLGTVVVYTKKHSTIIVKEDWPLKDCCDFKLNKLVKKLYKGELAKLYGSQQKVKSPV